MSQLTENSSPSRSSSMITLSPAAPNSLSCREETKGNPLAPLTICYIHVRVRSVPLDIPDRIADYNKTRHRLHKTITTTVRFTNIPLKNVLIVIHVF